MKCKTQISCLIVAGLSFLFCFAFIQSIQYGNERIPLSLTICGKNLNGLNVYFNNNISKDIPLNIKDSTDKKYIIEVPVYAYIRNLKIIIDFNKSIEISSIELQGNENRVIIKSFDIPYYFKYSNYLYNPKNKQFTQIDSSKTFDNPKLVITSIDISNFTNELYIKRTSLPKNILYSILISIIITIVYYFLFLKNSSRVSLKIVSSIVIIFITTISTYSMLNQRNTSKENLSEKSILDIIKPHTPNNLIYNGDFRYGLLFWGNNSDSTKQEIITTPFGKGIRITRTNGRKSNACLLYEGPLFDLVSGVNYKISFKYKIINGNSIPFYVGWWVSDGNSPSSKPASLSMQVEKIDSGWYKASTSYKFISNHINIPFQINRLKNNSVIEITDVSIIKE